MAMVEARTAEATKAVAEKVLVLRAEETAVDVTAEVEMVGGARAVVPREEAEMVGWRVAVALVEAAKVVIPEVSTVVAETVEAASEV